MLTRNELCDMQADKIRQARMALTMGMHDPTLMYEIAQLREIIHVVVEFENKLFNDNMDIDWISTHRINIPTNIQYQFSKHKSIWHSIFNMKFFQPGLEIRRLTPTP